MGAVALAVVIIFAVIVGLLLVLAALRRRRTMPQEGPPAPVHPDAPSYRPQARHSEYYRPHEAEDGPSPSSEGQVMQGPRGGPLPRCPLCDAAIGFDDAKCPKCKHDLGRF